MPLYDQEKMVKLVSELRKSVARLRSIGQLPCAEFLKDPDKIGSSKPDGTPRKLLYVSKLSLLGWKSKISLEDGIQQTYDCYLQQAVDK